MRKPRSDSKLKTLPEAVQAQIADWCAQDSLQSAVLRCAAELQPPVRTSLSAMSEWWAWYRLSATFSQADAHARQVEELLRRQFPGATPEKIAAAGQLVFTMQAANAQDTKEFRELEYLRITKETAFHKVEMDKAKLRQKDAQIRQKNEELALQLRRVQVLEAKLESIGKAVKDTKLTPEERAKRIAEIYGRA